MSWASRRRTLYLSGIGVVLILAAGIPLAFFLYQDPTCSDGKQNQGETSIDKGGPCDVLDERSITKETILFARSFPVRDGEYGMTAYVQNQNREAGVVAVPYRFSAYDERNVLVGEKTGTITIQPGAITPIYEGGLISGQRRVVRTFFEFTAPLTWVRAENPAKQLSVTNIRTSDLSGMPRLSADVTNSAIESTKNITYVATLFDAEGNAFASSRTVIPEIGAGETRAINFVWPQRFLATPARIDVLPVMQLTWQ